MSYMGLASCLMLSLIAVASAQTPVISLVEVFSGFARPVYFTNARDGTRRRFIVEQAGVIHVSQPGSGATAPFLDIQSRVLSDGEFGLLGLAFHPQYLTNGRFFVNYSRQPDGATVIAEFQVSSGNPNVADPNSEVVLLTIDQPYENHNGGMIE